MNFEREEGVGMILLIDNYDSFSYNLYQLIGEIDPEIKVIRKTISFCLPDPAGRRMPE